MMSFSKSALCTGLIALSLVTKPFLQGVWAEDVTAAAPTTAPTGPTVKIGGPAPVFSGKMVRGEPIAAFEPGKLYIMEFWATWCMPCRAAMPHVNALHEKFKDRGVVVIGQSVWENSPTAVESFLAKNGDEVSYRIAVDHKEGEPEMSRGAMARTWLTAAGIRSIPSTWMVKDGKVLWIGHPNDLNEAKIEAALAGTFDLINAQRELAAKNQRNKEQAEVTQRYWDAIHDKDAAAVDAAVIEVAALYADSPQVKVQYMVRGFVATGRYTQALELAHTYGQDMPPERAVSYKFQAIQDLTLTNPSDKAFLDNVQTMLDDIQIPNDDKTKIWESIRAKMQARIEALRGNYAKAVALQEQALSVMNDSPLKPVEEMILNEYKAGRSPSLMQKHSRDRKKPATQPTAKQS